MQISAIQYNMVINIVHIYYLFSHKIKLFSLNNLNIIITNFIFHSG